MAGCAWTVAPALDPGKEGQGRERVRAAEEGGRRGRDIGQGDEHPDSVLGRDHGPIDKRDRIAAEIKKQKETE